MKPTIEQLSTIPKVDLGEVILREVSKDDLHTLFEVGKNDKVTQYLTWNSYQDIDEAKTALDEYLNRPENDLPCTYAIAEKESNKLVGIADLFFVDWEYSIGEIGFFLSEAHWGKGLTTKICFELMKLSFDCYQLNRLVIRHHEGNSASAKVIQKCGFNHKNDVYWEAMNAHFPTYELYRADYQQLVNEIDKVKKVAQTLEFKFLTTPTKVHGGLLHKAYKIITHDDKYLVKILNPMIMKKKKAYDNTIFADQVAAFAKANGVNASCAIEVDGSTIIKEDDSMFQLYRWVNHVEYKHQPTNITQCKKIGLVLAMIHSIDFTAFEKEKPSPVSMVDLNEIESNLQGYEVDFDYLHSLSNQTFESYNGLEKTFISHRDLDPKNVLWNQQFEPIVIDWEAAGYVNREFELLNVALDWSKNDDASIDLIAFKTVVDTYKGQRKISRENLEVCFGAVHVHKLGWIEYCFERLLDVNEISKNEKDTAYTELIETINSMKAIDEVLMEVREIFQF